MKKLMRYRITAGRAVEVRDVLMEARGGTPRGARRGKSSAKQLKRNEDEAVLILARQLNANCKGGDLFLTLKYSDSRLPARRSVLPETSCGGWPGRTGRPRGKSSSGGW